MTSTGMKNYLLQLDHKLLAVVRQIGKEAARKRLPAYMVGGIVRDIILKRNNSDLDIVIEGDAACLAEGLGRKWNGTVTVYKKFGTAFVKTPDGLRVDLAMARQEEYAYSGALPVVRPGSLNEDLFRRDFTINAMAIAIGPDRFGRLIDQFGGLTDLSQKTIRVLHEQSFIDDPTRILRAVRFEQRFSFGMERQTLLLIKSALRKKIPMNVKPPRYFAEFKKILREEDPFKCLKRLHQLDGLRFLDPGFKVRLQDLNLLHRRVQNARRKSLYAQRDWWLVYFMGMVAKVDSRVIRNVLAKFPFTRNERAAIEQSRNSGDMIKKLSVRNLRPSQVFRILRPLTVETILYLRVLTSGPVICRRIDRFLAHDAEVKLCISGEDLKKIGIVSGARMGRILEDVLCLKMDKRIIAKTEELKAAQLLSNGTKRQDAVVK